jgi:hypothetical protein
MEMDSMLHISADLISGKEPMVPIELMVWVGPRAGLSALKKIQILPCLLWNPKFSFHFRKSSLVPILSQMSPVNNHPHAILSTCFNYILLSITNKMQRYTILFINVNALHVSGGFSAHHRELKICTHGIGYVPRLLAATASVGELELTHTSGHSKQTWHIPDAVWTVFELLMVGGETA